MPKGLRKASEGEQLINGITMVFAQATTDAVVASAALEPSVSLVGYLALFVGIGLVFVFVNLLVGRFLRPHNPHQEKGEIYECGEPTICLLYTSPSPRD